MEEFSSVDISLGGAQHFEKPAVAQGYAIAGRFISVESTDLESAQLFRHYFADWHVSPIPTGEDFQPDATIVVKTNTPPRAPSHVPSFEVAEGGVCRTDASIYYFQSNGSVVSVQGETPDRVEVWITPNEPGRDSRALARLVFNAAMSAMRRCGLYELHSAGVVSPGGEGILVIGPSGSGKSTLATTLASAGWQYLSDDTTLLYENDGRVKAHALRRLFALKDASRSTASQAALQSAASTVVPFDPLKKRFEPSVVFPSRFTRSCTPSTLVFSQISNEAKSRARRLSPAQSMARLLRMCPWACYDKSVAASHLNILARLARQANGFELLAGEDLLNDPDFAGRFLSELR